MASEPEGAAVVSTLVVGALAVGALVVGGSVDDVGVGVGIGGSERVPKHPSQPRHSAATVQLAHVENRPAGSRVEGSSVTSPSKGPRVRSMYLRCRNKESVV